MVERCADCGFDLAGGLVEVVPTAHYMMGGVEFAPDCRTAIAGLFAAGEDTGGVHGANRLGGNGVANSTVFGAIAGDAMAAWTRAEGELRVPDPAALEWPRRARAIPSGGRRPTSMRSARRSTRSCGRTSASCAMPRASPAPTRGSRSSATACHRGDRGNDLRYNLTWHDWLNLDSLVAVSRAICASAAARNESRGAHHREDFPARASSRIRHTPASPCRLDPFSSISSR
jgi:fumarate reductase flavoprotein subunit